MGGSKADVVRGESGATRRVRKAPAARRAELVATAREVFSAGGSSDSGMADVAQAANVSKGLLYHYFPAGRPELLSAVGLQLLDELTERLSQSANVPFSAAVRLEQVLAAIFAFFDENPTAYRLLFFEDGSDSGDNGPRHLARVRLSTELTTLMASSGVPTDQVLSMSAGLLGFVMANVELCLSGQVEPEAAWRISCRCAHALLDGV
jgi:AcrR family transcriptional regulator